MCLKNTYTLLVWQVIPYTRDISYRGVHQNFLLARKFVMTRSEITFGDPGQHTARSSPRDSGIMSLLVLLQGTSLGGNRNKIGRKKPGRPAPEAPNFLCCYYGYGLENGPSFKIAESNHLHARRNTGHPNHCHLNMMRGP
jgi:hypothetical protein